MFIKDTAVKPKLVEIVIDDDHIVEEYGESITFWMRDHLDINTYFDFFKHQGLEDKTPLLQTLKKIILTPEGLPAIEPDEDLPLDIILASLTKIGEQVGKSRTKLSKQEVGTQPE